MQLIDLTHTLSSESPNFVNTPLCLRLCSDYENTTAVSFRVQHLDMPAGIGTHLDAPAHIVKGGMCIDEIAPTQLFSPLIVIDVKAKTTAHSQLLAEDILAFEAKHGAIPAGSFVAIYTGWDAFWPSAQFSNDFKFPSIAPTAAHLLLKRNVTGIGVDTLSPDLPDSGYPVHDLMLKQGKLILECINNLQHMPATGSDILIAPLKIKGATEAPARVFGLIQGEHQD